MSHPSPDALAFIGSLTPPTTLEKLAAEGKFASAPLHMPHDVATAEWSFLLDGEPLDVSIREIYAPGDETGWAVVFKPSEDGMHTGETELIHGNWTLVRGEYDFSRGFGDKGRAVVDVKDIVVPGPCGVGVHVPKDALDHGAVGYGVQVEGA